MTRNWAEYDTWNTAIADVIFPEIDAPKPVYLDLEGEALEGLGKHTGTAVSDVESTLSSVVSETLTHNRGPKQIFAGHMTRMRRWVRNGRAEEPPFLALLATFCIAADQMAAGDGMSSNNYYGRLHSVFNWDKKDKSLAHGYRRVSEKLWGELNRWLVELDGLRGSPTAYALSHRYVGLSVSQALIRSSDHERLKEFFRQYGFAPGADVPPAEIKIPLGDWMAGRPSPVSAGLQNLWSKLAARDRIAEAASVGLANWDGSVRERANGEGAPTPGTLSLTLEIGGFPRKRFTLSALFYVNGATIPRTGTVVTANPPTIIEMIPDLPGALGLGPGSSIHPGDVLEGVLRIEDGLTKKSLERRPRRLVLFREDDLSRRWIESPQVMLGDSVRILAHETLAPRLQDVLNQVARPGWRASEPYPGQPDGWTLFTNVEIFSHPGNLVNSSKMDDLLPLIPLTTSQLKITGGFALPGRVRGKWHSWAPPEIRAISDSPGGFIVRLIDTHRFDDTSDEIQENVVAEWSDEGTGLVVQPVADLGLGDGDYRAELIPVGKRDPLTSTSLLLRSSDTPDLRQWASFENFGYGEGIGALGVKQPHLVEVIEGHSTPGVRRRLAVPDVTVPPTPHWTTGRHSRTKRPPLRITIPDADSCIRTGRHAELIETVPTDAQGKPLQAWAEGRCQGCGLVRRYPTRLKRSSFGGSPRRSTQQAPPAVTHDVSSLSPSLEPSGRDYATAFDALLHTGGGPWSQLERIALQVDASPLFVDQFARNLEVLGHIDIRRDESTLQPTHWEVCPTALVGTGSDYMFAGFWPNSLYSSITEHLADRGITFSTANVDEAPVQYFVTDASLPPEVSDQLSTLDIGVFEHAWQELVSMLPPLSQVLESLPRENASIEGHIRWFDISDARWVNTTSMDAPGAYRVHQFSTMDFFRTPTDIERGTIARSTVHLSKYLAGLLEGRPPMAYDSDQETLVVPLGADLPALYGRTVVAASGLPPIAHKKTGLLTYEFVPHDLANHIYDLLGR